MVLLQGCGIVLLVDHLLLMLSLNELLLVMLLLDVLLTTGDHKASLYHELLCVELFLLA